LKNKKKGKIKMNKKEKIVNWICDNYITSIKEYDWKKEDWYYLIEKAFKLNSMTLKELEDFKDELMEYN